MTHFKKGGIMKKFWANYRSTIILLIGITIGAIAGIVFKEKATVLSPLGDLFLNLLLVIIVPLIFLNVTTAISKMKQPKRLGKIIGSILIVFIITSLIAVLVGFISTYSVRLVSPEDGAQIRVALEENSDESKTEEMALADRTVKLLTVNDYSKLLSKEN